MIRTRICFLILFFTPLLVYWQTTFSDYGMRDDYANGREAREEPGKIVRFTASDGRPLYGALLETSMVKIDEIGNLWILRLAAVMLFTMLGLGLWRQLYHAGWTEVEAAVIGLGVTLLPGAQVITSWAMIWPHAMALLLSLAGFSAIETELERGGLKRAIALLGGCMIYAMAALIYQSNALFAVVPLAAVLLVRTNRGSFTDLRWGAIHLAALSAGLFTAYLMIRALFANGIFHASSRMQVETNLLAKLGWFFSNPVPNALALYALRDEFNTGAAIYWASALVVIGVIVWGVRAEIVRVGPGAGWKLMGCVLALPFLAHAVSLAASARASGYRTQLALSGLVLVLLVFALRSLRVAEKIKPIYHHIGLIVIVAIAAITAHFNAHTLISLPQSYEWETIRSAVMRAHFPKTSSIFIVAPTVEDRATKRMYSDEFGSISSDSDWVPKEMFLAALHEQYPVKLPEGTHPVVAIGREPPDGKSYDLVIDLRRFKDRAGP